MTDTGRSVATRRQARSVKRLYSQPGCFPDLYTSMSFSRISSTATAATQGEPVPGANITLAQLTAFQDGEEIRSVKTPLAKVLT